MENKHEYLYSKLPIGENEKILAVIKHHWFAYASVYVSAGVLGLIVLIAVIFIAGEQTSLQLSNDAVSAIVVFGVIFVGVIAAFSFIPVWIRKQESLVLTEEALLQVRKPSLFANDIAQVNLAHISDVNVTQNTLGTMFGFGTIVVETPGEQNNYVFPVVANPHEMAKKIIEAHENYSAALESGQIQTTLGARPPMPGTAWRDASQYSQQPPPAQPQNQPVEGAANPTDGRPGNTT